MIQNKEINEYHVKINSYHCFHSPGKSQQPQIRKIASDGGWDEPGLDVYFSGPTA